VKGMDLGWGSHGWNLGLWSICLRFPSSSSLL
jgi:hypothetical protein